MKIEPGEKGGKIIWTEEDWSHGLAPNWITSGGVSRVRGGNRMSYANQVNPFRKLGIALPGYNPSNATNASAIAAYLRKGIVNGTNAYIVSNGALLHRYEITTSTITNSGVWPHTITPHGGHTTVVGNDCVTYNAYVGGSYAQRFFYSWSDNTDWDIGTYDFTTTFDDDFMSTAPATPLASPYISGGVGFPHPLIVGDDDLLYVGDRNFIHGYDGSISANGKFYPAILTLPAGWVITSITKTADGLMIFSYFNNQTFGGSDDFRGQARAWEWKYGELDITRSYDLNDNLTSESFSLGNTIGVFTYGRQTDPGNTSKTSKIQIFDGTKFEPILGFVGLLPCRGGVEISADCITWNSGGTMYSYGSKVLGENMTETGLNRISNGASTSSGMVSTLWDSSNVLVMSSGATTAGGLQIFSTGFQEGGSLITALAEPFFPLYSKGKVTDVTIQFSNTVTPASSPNLSLSIFDENGNSQTLMTQYTGPTSGAEMIKQIKCTTAGGSLMPFESLSLYLLWGTASGGNPTEAFGPKRVEVTYEIINTNN